MGEAGLAERESRSGLGRRSQGFFGLLPEDDEGPGGFEVLILESVWMLRAEWVETELDLEGPGGAGGGDAAGTQGMCSTRRGAEAGNTKIGQRDGSVWGTETTSPFLS